MLRTLQQIMDADTGHVLLAAGGATMTTLTAWDLTLKIAIDVVVFGYVAIKLLRLVKRK